MGLFEFKKIGVIHSKYDKKADMPIQPKFSKSKGYIELDKKFEKGLANLNEFSHIILIYVLHKAKDFSLMVKPFLDNSSKGVFSTRAPARPNPIGLSIVKLDSIKGNIININNVDILDNTPLLDIKPYVPDFDKINASSGWVKGKIKKEHYSDTRFN